MNRVFTRIWTKVYYGTSVLLVISMTCAAPTFAQGMNYIMPNQSSNQGTNRDFNSPLGNYNQNNGYPVSESYPGTAYPITGNKQSFPNPSYQNPPSNLTPALANQAAELTNQAYKLSTDGNNEQAIELLKQALLIDPVSSVAHLDMAVSLIALKRYDEALKESTIALQLNPDEEKGYLNYLAAAIGANRMPDALRVGQEYLNRFPNGRNKTTLTNEMIAVSQEMDRRAKARGVMAPPGSPDNYLFFATPNGKRGWPPYMMPLKVYINPGKHFKGFQPAFETTLIAAFMTWQNATRGSIRFIPVSDVREANIECRWTDSLKDVSLAAEAGDARIVANRITNGIVHVTITLLTCRPDIPAEKLTLNLMQQVCLHEIGHALGIDGHSDNAQDIMYCATDPNVEHVELSQRDLNTLFLIYH